MAAECDLHRSQSPTEAGHGRVCVCVCMRMCRGTSGMPVCVRVSVLTLWSLG